MKKIRKALETIAHGYSQGNCSIDTLIKACNNYKIRENIVDDLDYEILVAKSCIDSINGVEQDPEICKGIVPGQTKVVDGVLYVYSATKKGSKTEYDWHVVRKGAKTQTEIGRGSKLTDKSIQGKQKYINELFPNDLSALKVVKTLGGSTGAQLVEDADGNQYVLKRGSNTSSDHVKAEYLSNQLYGVMGLKTPDYELYDDNGEAVLLSRFIPGTHVPNSSDFAKMSEGFIADCLLANWDVYQNDNCLIKNANGSVYRVDNGGCLNYRAQGKQKTFDGNVYDTWKSMARYNPGISNLLDEDAQLQQITEILKKKDDVVNFLKESGEDVLAATMAARFDDLRRVSDELTTQKNNKAAVAAAKLGKIMPRTLKPDDEMYGELDDKTIQTLIDNTAKQVGCKPDDKYLLTAQDKQGWALLANICHQRGFDARPQVVSEDEFWKLRKSTKWPMMFRGFSIGQKGVDDFKFNDWCHFGIYGIWGQGIYAHSDDHSKMTKNDQHSGAPVDLKSNEKNWKNAESYSRSSESALNYSSGGAAVKMFWHPDAKIVNSEDLLDEIKAIGAAAMNSPKAKKLKKELDEIKDNWKKAELDLLNVADIVKQQVFSQIGYDETAVADLTDFLQNVNWGSRNAQGKRNYPMFDEVVKGKIKPVVEKCGGTAEIINEGGEDEQLHIEIGGDNLYLSKYSWNNNAVKQKNQFTSPYHFQAERFITFFDTNCVKPANDALQKELDSGNKSKELKDKVTKLKKDYYDKEKEYNDETAGAVAGGTGAVKGTDIYSRIYNIARHCTYQDSGNRDKSVIGIYAALKGYDGIYQPDGNSSGHGFTIILNRSKIITSID